MAESGFRLHGQGTPDVAVLHGGPGALGGAHGLAREIAAMGHGVLEPLGAALTIDGQVGDLGAAIAAQCRGPVVLAGHSWGALLALIMAARHPELVRGLVLVACPPLSGDAAPGITARRLERMSPEEQRELHDLAARLAELEHGGAAQDMAQEMDHLLYRMGTLFKRADLVDPIQGALEEDAHVQCRYDVFRSIWTEASELREHGGLLEPVARVACAVAALHGDQDAHPAGAVRRDLEQLLPHCRFHLLERCGHYPWLERDALHQFRELLQRELAMLVA